MTHFQSTPPLLLQLGYQWYPCIESLRIVYVVLSVSLLYLSRAAEKRLVVMAPVLLTALYKIVEQPDEVVVPSIITNTTCHVFFL